MGNFLLPTLRRFTAAAANAAHVVPALSAADVVRSPTARNLREALEG
jgi:hypothetical protein